MPDRLPCRPDVLVFGALCTPMHGPEAGLRSRSCVRFLCNLRLVPLAHPQPVIQQRARHSALELHTLHAPLVARIVVAQSASCTIQKT